MKILLINYEFPPLGGGAATASFYMSKELVRLGHKVTVLTTHFKGLKGRELLHGVDVIRVHSKRNKKESSKPTEMISFVIEATKGCNDIIEKFKPDFCVAYFSIPSGIVSLYLKFRFRLDYVILLRGGDVPGFQGKELILWHFLTFPLTLLIWAKAVFVAANSHYLQKLAQKSAFLIGKRVLLIPNGVILQKKRARNYNKVVNVLFVGRLVNQKQPYELVNIARHLRDKNIDFKIDIVGDGDLRASLESKFSAQGYTKRNVRFHGWVDRSSINSFYTKANVLVLPSKDEGMSNVLLEAMSFGLPVVVSDIPANRELVGRVGLVVKNGQTSTFGHAVEIIFKDRKKYDKMVKRTLELVKKYGWGTSSKILLAHYERTTKI